MNKARIIVVAFISLLGYKVLGANWSAELDSFQSCGVGWPINQVSAIATTPDGTLWVAHSKSTDYTGGVTETRLVKWTPSAGWDYRGATCTSGVWEIKGAVSAMCADGNNLVISGDFETVRQPGSTVVLGSKHLVRFNPALNQYSSIPTGVNGVQGAVSVMVPYSGSVFIGGDFTSIAGVSSRYVIRLSGNTFVSMSGIPQPPTTPVSYVNPGVKSISIVVGSSSYDVVVAGNFLLGLSRDIARYKIPTQQGVSGGWSGFGYGLRLIGDTPSGCSAPCIYGDGDYISYVADVLTHGSSVYATGGFNSVQTGGVSAGYSVPGCGCLSSFFPRDIAGAVAGTSSGGINSSFSNWGAFPVACDRYSDVVAPKVSHGSFVYLLRNSNCESPGDNSGVNLWRVNPASNTWEKLGVPGSIQGFGVASVAKTTSRIFFAGKSNGAPFISSLLVP